MRGWGCLPPAYLPLPWFEQIGELFNGENPLSLILAHHPRCHAMEQTKIILLFRLGVTPTLKGAQRAMFIQDNGWWFGRVHCSPFLEGLKKQSEGFCTCSQF